MADPPTDRPPLDERDLARALVVADGLWRGVRVVARTGSTNADLLAAAAGGAPEGTVLVAEEQTAGRGRLDRTWTAPPGSALTFSALLRPAAPAASWSWLPLLAGLAVAVGVRRGAGVEADLKWPNDVLVAGRKLAGVLAQSAGGAVVVGVGLNVSQRAGELPVPTATSVALERGVDAAPVAREPLLLAVLGELANRYGAWCRADGDSDRSGLHGAYAARCVTLGRHVRVELPGGDVAEGQAVDVDSAGRLVVQAPGAAPRAVGAGDVVHVR